MSRLDKKVSCYVCPWETSPDAESHCFLETIGVGDASHGNAELKKTRLQKVFGPGTTSRPLGITPRPHYNCRRYAEAYLAPPDMHFVPGFFRRCLSRLAPSTKFAGTRFVLG